jgi:alkanesulfonate monooxygenase SsuD/methylene tetrahydromethanopterin reductase-like flavin-dependent oxidoreductase (luciferase family)
VPNHTLDRRSDPASDANRGRLEQDDYLTGMSGNNFFHGTTDDARDKLDELERMALEALDEF